MKKTKPIKLIFKRLILLLAFGVISISNTYSQTYDTINLTKSIDPDCYGCAAGDSLDINGDTIPDIYVKIQQWQIISGSYSLKANALIIWGAANDSVGGACFGGGTLKTLIPGSTIGSGTDWDKITHPFYLEPGMPWICDCNCSSAQTTYIGLRFLTRYGAVRYGWLRITYTLTSYTLEVAAFMNNGNPITIPEN